ncbi:MAG: group II truncated hemoglobin [Gammaproteobacteria bacterium]|nr:group II truncated hemoglobin [Gammaproteobacteria bacterium]
MTSIDNNNHYQRIGGEKAIRLLVHRFYQLMDELPEAYEIRKLHAPDLTQAEEKLYMFLCGWMGGPPLYIEQYGHPRLRMRHAPFAIGNRERDQWMMCMQQAMTDIEVDQTLYEDLQQAFFKVADFMRNKAD